FLLLFALALGVAARSILAKGRFGLGFGITWQLFQALIGASLLRGALYWQGGRALLLAVAAFVLLTRLLRSTPLPGGERRADRCLRGAGPAPERSGAGPVPWRRRGGSARAAP